MEQEKIKAVKEWKMLMKVKDIESFLVFANFYRRFIQNFSHMAKPLNKLKGKKKWTWNKEYQKAFKELKDYKSTSTISFKERRKIQSGNRHLRIYHQRSIIPGTRGKMETNSIFIQDDTTSRKKL